MMMLSINTRDISDEISSSIREATLGSGSWSDVCLNFTEAFPGSFAAIVNQSFMRPDLSLAIAIGLEEKHLHSFLSHYCHVNPWRGFWQYGRNGAIAVSERDDPTSQYFGSEFYNDWMRPVGDVDASVGLRLQVADDEVSYLSVHFSASLSSSYDQQLEAVMQNTRLALKNALEIASYLRDTSGRIAAKSALISLGNIIAFVVDERLKLKEANQVATEAFARDFPVGCRQNAISFTTPSVTASLTKRLRNRPRDFATKLVMQTENDRWLITVNQLPQAPGILLVRERDQFLVQMRRLTSQNERLDGDILVQTYGLTPSELGLCRALAAGLMLADAASANRISYENSRQKLKSIFRKTGVGSQSDLKALLRIFG
ncbi:helix-turn-helix transcriptional regulator [Agrobacterium salinitolerans]|uniref:helix-turn-helix transcriptional regulator n=1 Tax=Agrobacterium salinitolerans TaxID=1183413 RepID=UPI0015741F8C|nr:helix-turn-helix transcriptional regulator [Agrobacterium salinitolerans]